MKTSWVNVLIIVAIILVPASFVLRAIYGAQLLEWEYKLIESWGINRLAYSVIKVVGFMGFLIYLFVRQKRRRKRENASYYELPK